MMKFFKPKNKSHEFLPDADEIEMTPVPKGISVTLYLLLSMMIIFFLWSYFSKIDEVISTRGKLVATLPNIVLQPIETSQIATLNASVGQIVRKGDVLATLDPTVTGADLKQVQERLASLDAQVRRLEAERDGKVFTGTQNEHDILQGNLDTGRSEAFRARLTRLNENISRIKSSILNNDLEIKNLENRLQSLKEIETMNEQLVEKQFQSRKGLLEIRDKRLEIESTMLSAKNKNNELRKELSGTEADRAAFVSEYRQKVLEELVTTQRERDSLSDQLIKNERRSSSITIEAPEDSVVLEVAKLSRGSVIREAEALVTLVPLNASLEAEVKIEASDISNVNVGDPVRVKIDAFPFQKHGIVEGKILRISQDTTSSTADDKKNTFGFYTARVQLKEISLDNLNKPLKVLPGMTLTGEIVVGKRSIFSYIAYPIMKTKDEAIREY
jgi:HlyD family secretion protein